MQAKHKFSDTHFYFSLLMHETSSITMGDQSQTTANAPSEPVLCKMGCGFFGNAATSGCCSKCWMDKQKKLGNDAVATLPPKKPQLSAPADAAMPDVKPVVVDGKTEEPKEKETDAEEPVSAAAPKKNKGKKKLSYKSMMAGMMHTQSESTKADKEKEALRKVTGGGAFQKIEKI